MSIDLIDWLAKQPLYPKVYWNEHQRGREIAACGIEHQPSSIENLSSCSKPYFGAFAFPSKKKDALWKDFPSAYFFLPEQILIQEPSQIPTRYDEIQLNQLQETPHFSNWENRVQKALSFIQKRELDKVVLARRTSFVSNQTIDPLNLLAKLKNRALNSTLFYFQPTPDAAFLGASPEKLYVRRGREIHCDAIAGTRTKKKEEDERLLLASKKEGEEFLFVKEFIESRLAPFCTKLKSEKTSVLKTSTLLHLFAKFSGQLKSGVLDRDLLLALHPTPAVAGTPQTAALAFLEKEEEFGRGWYAAPLGWVHEDEADFTVGIRSALVTGNEMHLFAGAGIVQDSDPKKEWDELNQKIQQFL